MSIADIKKTTEQKMQKSVEAFKHDLATGPAFSSVENVEEINLDPTGDYSSFRIER